MRQRMLNIAVGSVAAALALSACASGTKADSADSASTTKVVPIASVTSATAFGGMDALVAAAKKEGTLNVITLSPDWANYGEIMKGFTTKYGIKINSANPDGSSADEITAIKSLKGQDRAPDVVDVGQGFALSGAAEGLYAPYQVATFADIPASLKEQNGTWVNDYGGYVSIGCDTGKITVCPTTLAALNNPIYKGKLALNGDPTKANAAFSAVWAAGLAKGGSLDDIKPGIDFFGQLKKAGVYVPVQATAATIESGETPLVLDWDYLNVSKANTLKAKGRTFTVAVPTDGHYSSYYAQAISKYAPHPAAARLWEEYLYSVDGQNGWLAGSARPVLLAAMTAAKTVDPAAAALLPAVTEAPVFPTAAQITAAKALVTQSWASTVK